MRTVADSNEGEEFSSASSKGSFLPGWSAQLLWNKAKADFSEIEQCCIHQLFEAQVAKTPDALAVLEPQADGSVRQWTYGQLNAEADRLARVLRDAGTQPDAIVGLMFERSLEMVAALLGVLKSGAAYLPLDPAYPGERLEYMLADSGAAFVVAQTHLLPRLANVKARLICWEELPAYRSALESAVKPNRLAYLIYTSGSTGRPKGVMIEHRSLVNHSHFIASRYRLAPGERVLQFASLSFDVAAEEIFPTLISGATLVLRTREVQESARKLFHFVQQFGLAVLNLPASFWREIVHELETLPVPIPPTMRLLVVGNEKVLVDTCKRWSRLVDDHVEWLNAYGPTEATITATLFSPREEPPSALDALAAVPIGRPIANVQAFLLDESGNPVPPGEVGELHLGGAGLARGYLNAPDLTAAKFIPHPLRPGERLYKTGDRARFLPDGNLEFLGRVDEQVKIRGYRVELGEIEAVLQTLPGVAEAAVSLRVPADTAPQLAAYIVLRPGTPALDSSHLREQARQRLPDYMVPATWSIMGSLPRLPNGKLNRQALPDHEVASAAKNFSPPRNPTEEMLARIFAQVLGRERVGVDEDFWEAGGDSLRAMQVLARIHQQLGIEPGLKLLFEKRTVAALAQAWSETEGSPLQDLLPISRSGELELSFAQQRLWFLQQMEPGSWAYNMPELVRFTGALDASALERSLAWVVSRHEVLRTCYPQTDGRPSQQALPQVNIPWQVVTLEHLPPDARSAEADVLARRKAREPFNLAADPPVRALLLRLSDTEHWLLLVVHHIASDAWSMAIFYDELLAGYDAFRQGREPALPPLDIQYADYAAWQRKCLAAPRLEQDLAFWREQLHHGPQLLELPFDRPRPAAKTFHGATVSRPLSATLGARLQDLARHQQVTFFALLLSAFKTLLHRYSGQEDMVIGVPAAGRTRVELESLVGFFVNTLALRSHLTAQETFVQFLRREQATVLAAFQHQEIPFEKLVEELKPERDPAIAPFFQVMFALQNAPRPRLDLPGLNVTVQELGDGAALFDLTLQVLDEENTFRLVWTYNTDLFEQGSILNLAEAFDALLHGIVSEPSRPIGKLPLSIDRGRLSEGAQVILDLATESPAPRGAVGELATRSQTGVLHRSGVLARVRANAEIEILGPKARQAWLGGRRLNLARIEDVLRIAPGVHDAAILCRYTREGVPTLVAYLVLRPGSNLDRLQPYCGERLLKHEIPHALVAVPALPYTESGRLDVSTLESVPVLSNRVLSRCAAALREQFGSNPFHIAAEDCPELIPRWHLSDLLPDWQTQPLPSPAGGSRSSTSPVVQSDTPSVLEGGPLHLASGSPSTLPEMLRQAASTGAGELLCLDAESCETRWSTAELAEQASRILAGLRHLGLQPGDKVILQLPQPVDFFPAFWGCMLGGFVPVPVAIPGAVDPANSGFRKLLAAAEELKKPVVLSTSRLFQQLHAWNAAQSGELFRLADTQLLLNNAPDSNWHDAEPSDLALLMLTSGSTGRPKMVRLTHSNLLGSVAGSVQLNGFSRDEVTLNWLPLDHVGGLIFFHLRDLFLGAKQIHATIDAFLGDPLLWLRWIDKYRVTITWAPNFAFALINERAARVREARLNLGCLRVVLNGAEAIVARTSRDFLKLLAPHGLSPAAMRPAWGMAETASGSIYSLTFRLESSADADAFVPVGKPIPGMSLRIVDESGRPVPCGQRGRLQVKGLPVTSGYLDDPEANAQAFTADGWFETGDIGFLQNSELVLAGRAKETIIIHGANYSSHEIESVVEKIPGVQVSATAACAVRDGRSQTDQLAIFFVPRENIPLADLISAIRTRVTRELGLAPAHILPLEAAAIPRTSIGKIQRSLLKQGFEQGEFNEVARKADLLAANTNTLPNWFYQVQWQRRIAEPAVPASGTLVLIGDAQGLAAKLAALSPRPLVAVEIGPDFVQRNQHHFILSPENPEHWRRLLDAIASTPLAGVVHLDTFGPGKAGETAELVLSNLLCCMRALSNGNRAEPLPLLVVSSHSQPVDSRDQLLPHRAALPAFLRASDLPGLRCRHLDLPDGDGAAEEILREIWSAASEPEVAIRPSGRWVPVLQRVAFEPGVAPTFDYEPGGIYCITGGLGGVGFHLAKHLLDRFKARVLLLGRSDDNAPAVAERLQLLKQSASNAAQCLYRSVDVADVTALGKVLAEAEGLWRGRVAGVFHLAGVAEEMSLGDMTTEHISASCRAKVQGLIALDQVLSARPEAALIAFSSVTSFFGGAGYAAYAAANRFVESFTHLRRDRGHTKTFCFAWSMWSGVGMNLAFTQRDAARRFGFEAIAPEQGLASLRVALRQGKSHLLIGLDGANPHIARELQPPVLPLRRLCVRFGSGPTDPNAVLVDDFGTRITCRFEKVKELPLSCLGEVDEAMLGRLADARAAFVPPRTPTEKKMAELWAELLGRDQVGVEDNFFDLGGHSLLATQLVSRIRQVFRAELALQSIFDSPTLAALSARVESTRRQESPLRPIPIRPIARQGEFPLSYAQERLWFVDQLAPGSPLYNIPAVFRIRGPVDVAALQYSLDQIVERHETLRTTFKVVNDAPVQFVASAASPALEVRDISGTSADVREAEARRLLVDEARRPFDLSRGPLFRAALFHLGPRDHFLCLTFHHVIADGWSLGIFLRELAQFYSAKTKSIAPDFPEPPIQYADFAQWQRQWLQGEVLRHQLDFWEKHLGPKPPVTQLPMDRPRPPVQSFLGATFVFDLPATLRDQLNALSRREGTTLFMTLLAAFKTLLCRYTGQEDLVVGTPVANRTRAELESLIGFFANTLVLRSDLAGNPTFRELLQRVQKTALQAFAHQDLPFEKLVEALNPARDLSHQPLFQVMFVLQNASAEPLKLADAALESVEVDIGMSMFDLTWALEEGPSGLKGRVEYNSDLFDAARIERMAGHFQVLLEGICRAPDQKISLLPILPESERRLLLHDWAGDRQSFPAPRALHEIFEAQAAQRPDAPALTASAKALTYAELNRQANRLAHRLRTLGVGPEKFVAIHLDRSADMVIAILAVLKAGGAYVPIDAACPPERLAFMLQDTQAPVVLTQQKLVSSLDSKTRATIIALDADATGTAAASEENLGVTARPEHPAYVIYTSGSTGQPKGVVVTHSNVTRLFDCTQVRFNFGPSDVWTLFHSVAFDFSVWEIWGALLYGGRLVVVSYEDSRSPAAFYQLLSREGVTVLNQTPSAFIQLSRHEEDAASKLPLKLRYVIFGGEALALGSLKPWFDRHGDASPQLVNMYGITETTVHVTWRWLRASDVGQGSVIGRAIPDLQLFLLDPAQQLVPIGVPGEICVAGPGLARGYLNAPDLTAARFIPNPFEPGSRLYRSGDLARYRADGELEYLGRIDHQVKIRGFRVELGEIESALTRHPAIASSVVLLRDDPSGDKRLVAYLVLRSGNMPPAQELREHLRGALPDYMVPSAFVSLEKLPLTANGKVDRAALPSPDASRAGSGADMIGPRNAVELQLQRIWETVLGVKPIGMRDNFFHLGGHSLLAVRLFAQLEKTFHRSLPLATLFQAPTIEQLANVLSQEAWDAPWSSLVAIQPSGTRPPFFIIHGIGGNVLNFHGLAVHLGPDQPVYGLQSQGLDGKRQTPTRIEDMAAHYLAEIRTLQPEGPYYLGGMSFGGVVAYEMAQQLLRQGQTVGLLALLDTFPLGYSELMPITERSRRELHVLTRRVQMHIQAFLKVPFGQKLNYLGKKVRTLKRRVRSRFWQMAYRLRSGDDEELPEALQNVKEANYLAAEGYITQPYAGKITLFIASEQSIPDLYDPKEVWAKLATGGVETISIPGDHVTLIEEPHVQILASRLRSCLTRNPGN